MRCDCCLFVGGTLCENVCVWVERQKGSDRCEAEWALENEHFRGLHLGEGDGYFMKGKDSARRTRGCRKASHSSLLARPAL